jgi:hypothetical protein
MENESCPTALFRSKANLNCIFNDLVVFWVNISRSIQEASFFFICIFLLKKVKRKEKLIIKPIAGATSAETYCLITLHIFKFVRYLLILTIFHTTMHIFELALGNSYGKYLLTDSFLHCLSDDLSNAHCFNIIKELMVTIPRYILLHYIIIL